MKQGKNLIKKMLNDVFELNHFDIEVDLSTVATNPAAFRGFFQITPQWQLNGGKMQFD